MPLNIYLVEIIDKLHFECWRPILGSDRISENWKPFKMTKNDFNCMLKAPFVLEIFNFLSWLFADVGNWLDKKTKVNFEMYGVTDCETNNYSTHIAQYFKKLRQPVTEILLVDRILHEQGFYSKIIYKNLDRDDSPIMGHLKTLGTQMGYPIGVLIWVVVEINDQTISRSILLSRRCQPGLPN